MFISHYYYTMYFTLAMLIMMTVLLEYIDLFSINFTKYISSYTGIMLGAFIATYYHNRRVPRLAAQEIITIFA